MTTNVKDEIPQSTPHSQTIVINSEQLYGTHRNEEDDIDLKELFSVIWGGKWITLTITLIFAMSAVYYSLNLPNIYKASAVLIPANSEDASGSGMLASRLGGLASMAGVNLGGGVTDKTKVAIETLQSRAFLGDFINRHNLKAEILAVKKWDASSNKLVFDSEIYNEKINKWKWHTSSHWKKNTSPSEQEAIEEIKKKMLVTFDEDKGLITLNVSHQSPYISQQWVSWLIDDINQHMRKNDIKEAHKNIQYIKKQLDETPIADMQKIFYLLIEQQTKIMMLAEVSDEYVLKIIDPAVVPEKKDKPQRAIICIMATLSGGVLGIFLSCLLHIRTSFKKSGLNENRALANNSPNTP